MGTDARNFPTSMCLTVKSMVEWVASDVHVPVGSAVRVLSSVDMRASSSGTVGLSCKRTLVRFYFAAHDAGAAVCFPARYPA